jgi:hypothetical protein
LLSAVDLGSPIEIFRQKEASTPGRAEETTSMQVVQESAPEAGIARRLHQTDRLPPEEIPQQMVRGECDWKEIHLPLEADYIGGGRKQLLYLGIQQPRVTCESCERAIREMTTEELHSRTKRCTAEIVRQFAPVRDVDVKDRLPGSQHLPPLSGREPHFSLESAPDGKDGVAHDSFVCQDQSSCPLPVPPTVVRVWPAAISSVLDTVFRESDYHLRCLVAKDANRRVVGGELELKPAQAIQIPTNMLRQPLK